VPLESFRMWPPAACRSPIDATFVRALCHQLKEWNEDVL
jgi:hypothetical protein